MKKTFIIIVLPLIICLGLWFWGYTIRGGSNDIVTISTTEWLVVDVSKQKHDLEIVQINGWTPKWLLSVNDTLHERSIPLKEGEKLHLDYNAKTLYIRLAPDQGITHAQMKVTKK